MTISYQRFVERQDVRELVDRSIKQDDFRNRLHTLPPRWVVYFFIAVLLMVVGLVVQLGITLMIIPAGAPTPVDEIVAVLGITVILMLGCTFYAYRLIKRLTNIILYTEFQNLMMSRSLDSTCDFYLLLSDTGQVIYFNDAFRKRFDVEDAAHPHPLTKLTEHKDMKKADAKRLTDALKEKRSEVVLLKAKDVGNYTLHIEPLNKPRDYLFVRGSKTD